MTENPTGPSGGHESDRSGAPIGGRFSRRARLTFVAIAVAAVVVSAGVLAYPHASASTVCAISREIGEYNVSAPAIISNIPDGGGSGVNTSGQNWSFSSGSVVLGNQSTSSVSVGVWSIVNSSGLLLELDQPIFAVYEVQNVSGPSSGTSDPCTQPYVAASVGPVPCGSGIYTQYSLPEPMNDSMEPQVFNASCPGSSNSSDVLSGAYMSIDNAYPNAPSTGSTVTLNLCSWTDEFSQSVFGAVALPVTLHAPFDGNALSVHGYLWWVSAFGESPTATYSLPPGAIWRVATVGLYSEDTVGLLPPGLLAFQEIPCP